MMLHLNSRRIVLIDGRGRLISRFVSLFSRKCIVIMPIQITHEVTIRIDIILLCLNPQYSSQKMKRNSHANVIIFSFSLIIYNDNNFHFIISFLLKAIRLCTNSFSIRLCLVFSISYNYSRYHFVVQFDKLSHSDILRLQQLVQKNF